MSLKTSALCLGLALAACLPLTAQTTYNFQTVDFTNDKFTQLLGINNSNIIAGYHGASVNKGFTYDLATGVFTKENFPNSAQTQVIGINNKGKTVGFYVDQAGSVHGFVARAGMFTKADFPGTPFNQLLGQNDFSQAVGYYSTKADGTGPDHAYILNEAGNVYEVLTIPHSTSAQATGINNQSSVCGFYVDAGGVNHGWLLVQGTFTVLDFPMSTGSQALGVNGNGIVVGFYTDSAQNTHGFTYNSATKVWQSIDDPNGVGTTIVNGINDNGLLVGFSGTAPINSGFVATPVAP